jgi:hypothetical protein
VQKTAKIMEQKPLYSISWTDFITREPCILKVWGNVDKIEGHVYYTCLFNIQSIVVFNFNGQWLDNSGKDNELAAKLGRLLDSCGFLLELRGSGKDR